ncbi:tellurite resistance TerB family protein [Phormidesmis priestleyi]
MNPNQNVKNLIKILIAAAWLDGKIQPEERQYLHQLATEKGVENDLEIQPLLHEFRAVTSDECYEWVREYLGDRPSSETCQSLIESVSALIYRDGTIATEEAKLLTRLQLLDSGSETSESVFDKVLVEIRKLYERGISKL